MASRSKKKGSGGCAFLCLLAVLYLTSSGFSFKRDWVETSGRVTSYKVRNSTELRLGYTYDAPERGGGRRSYSDTDTVPRIRYPNVGEGSIVPVVYDKDWPSRSSIGTKERRGNTTTWREDVMGYGLYVIIIPAILGLLGLGVRGKKRR